MLQPHVTPNPPPHEEKQRAPRTCGAKKNPVDSNPRRVSRGCLNTGKVCGAEIRKSARPHSQRVDAWLEKM